MLIIDFSYFLHQYVQWIRVNKNANPRINIIGLVLLSIIITNIPSMIYVLEKLAKFCNFTTEFI